MHDDLTAAELREALAATLEALAIPFAATMGDEETRAGILDQRLGHTVAMLRGILGEDAAPDVAWSVRHLRSQLAKHPAQGYRTWDERMAELDAAKAGAS